MIHVAAPGAPSGLIDECRGAVREALWCLVHEYANGAREAAWELLAELDLGDRLDAIRAAIDGSSGRGGGPRWGLNETAVALGGVRVRLEGDSPRPVDE